MSSLTFDPKVGVIVPEPMDVRQATAEKLKEIFSQVGEPELNTDAGTPAGQLVDLIAGEEISVNAKLAFIVQQLNPAIASGRWHEALGKLYFLERKLAEPTVVTCQLRGLPGTVIPYGAQVSTFDGETLMCTGIVTLGEDGTAEALFRSMTTGPIEIAPKAIDTIVTLVPGWDSVTNEASGATGRYEETRAEFEARRVASVAINSTGYLESIQAAIGDVQGVIDSKVLENMTSETTTEYGVTLKPHSIAVCVYGGDDKDIARALAYKKPPGTDTNGETEVTFDANIQSRVYKFRIIRPVPTDVKIKIRLDKEVSKEIKEDVIEAVYEEFLGNGPSGRDRVSLAEELYAYRFAPTIIAAIGQNSHLVNVEISLGSGSFGSQITIDADVEPVLARSNITVNWG